MNMATCLKHFYVFISDLLQTYAYLLRTWFVKNNETSGSRFKIYSQATPIIVAANHFVHPHVALLCTAESNWLNALAVTFISSTKVPNFIFVCPFWLLRGKRGCWKLCISCSSHFASILLRIIIGADFVYFYHWWQWSTLSNESQQHMLLVLIWTDPLHYLETFSFHF